MKTLSDVRKGSLVWVDGDSGFCHGPEQERVTGVSVRYNELTGAAYNVIHLSEGRTFDSRDGSAIDGPSAYYIHVVEDDVDPLVRLQAKHDRIVKQLQKVKEELHAGYMQRKTEMEDEDR